MEHLTKQQIVLLTLFTSFVTSIATGIVTVALTDQNSPGVGGTINNVIERTIEEVVPSASTTSQSASAINGAAGTFNDPADQIAYAASMAQKNVVKIMLNNTVTGLGVIVASSGIIMSDKSAVAVYGNYTAVTADGKQYPLQLLQSQNDGDIVFLLANSALPSGGLPAAHLIPLSNKNALRLGETVIVLSGTSTPSIDEGIIERVDTASSTPTVIHTNIDSSDVTVSAALFDTAGNFLGLKTLSIPAGDFYPVAALQAVIPTL